MTDGMSDHGTAAETDRQRAARWAAGCFGVAAVCAVALAITYVAGGEPQIEGALLFAGFGAIAVGLVLWAARVLPEEVRVEERLQMDDEASDQDEVAEDLSRHGTLGRRKLLLASFGSAVVAFAAALAIPFRSLGPSVGKKLVRTPWAGGKLVVDEAGSPVTAEAVEMGSIQTIFPEGHTGSADGQAVLVRIRPGRNRPRPGREDWAPEGIIAYSKVCSHAGCPVGLYLAEVEELLCPCHQSTFDVTDGAEPQAGPAGWPLPQLPLRIDDEGKLVSRGDFSGPVGPGWWSE